jgi:iron(III) transport system substrate-binding protein
VAMFARRAITLLTLALPLALALPARAQPDQVDMDAAKKEGTVSWYTSTPIETAQRLARKFTEQTGIKVQLFRSGGEAVLRRFFQELDAKKVAADVLTVSDPTATEELIRRGALVAFKPKNFDKVPDEFKNKDGYAVAQRLNLLGIVVRTDLVPEADRPKNWPDLTDPKYKGKMVMPDPSFTANQLMVVGMLSRKYGWEFYQKLKANDIMIVQGHQQVSDTLKRGERIIAAEGSDAYAYDDRKDGHKVEMVFPAEGAFGVPAPTMIIKGSPSPNAAKALAEFMISDTAQGMLAEDGSYAARSDIKPPAGSRPLKDIKFIPIDYAHIEKEKQNIKNRFNEIYQ